MASDITQHRPGADRPPSAEEESSSSDAAPVFPWAESTLDAQLALRLGFWAAILATAFTVLFVVLAISFDGEAWSGIEDYTRNFDSLQMAQLVPVLLLAPTVVVMMASIHAVTPPARKVLSMTAVVFSGVYAAIIATNYMVQLFVVRLNVLNNDLEGLSLLAMENPSSVFVALETIGYGFFGLIMLASGAVFAEGRLERWIRGLFFASGVTGILGAVAAPLGQEMLTLIGFGLSLLAFLAATVLVGVFFKRLTRQLPTPT